MERPGKCWAALLLLAALAAGCRRTTRDPAGTGAKETARSWYEALVRQDWPEAYRLLHPDSRGPCSSDQFARLAQSHRADLGFEPDGVRLRFCTEQGAEAIAHMTLTGHADGRQRAYKESIALRRGTEGWGVVLSPRFGMKR